MRYLAATLRGLLFAVLSVLAAMVSCALLTCVQLIPLGIGSYLFPPVARCLRKLANWARSWYGIPHPETLPLENGFRASRVILYREVVWKELAWGMIDWISGGLIALLPATLLTYGVYGAFVQPFVWRLIVNAGGSQWFAFIHVQSTATALLSVPLALAFCAIGLGGAPRLMKLHAQMTGAWLAPGRAELTRRVATLTDSRAALTDSSAAELRRIERDLHDGAQARLVAMGMTLDSAGRTLKRNPEAAYELIMEAREASSKALNELRDLVRGIHPPVLADRGLAHAVRALALDTALEIWVEDELPGRLPLPMESAAYFAINEALVNVVKHANASLVTIALSHDGERLRILVTDDGRGGAKSEGSGGLPGIARRLGAFDGTITVDSPPGGPTVVRMEIPCVSSSPKTSFS
jgi:signal transduction histidine kinase